MTVTENIELLWILVDSQKTLDKVCLTRMGRRKLYCFSLEIKVIKLLDELNKEHWVQ